MKYHLLFIFIIALSFCSCRKKDKPLTAQVVEKKETPKALRNSDTRGSSLGKWGRTDLLDQVYSELAEHRPDLQEIETLIQQSDELSTDLQEKYNEFSDTKERYYGSARQQTSQLKDSLLKARIMKVLETSMARNNAKSAGLNALIQLINQKQTSIHDYHFALKVIVTLPAIDDYQNNNLPNAKPYNGLKLQQDSALLRMKKIIK